MLRHPLNSLTPVPILEVSPAPRSILYPLPPRLLPAEQNFYNSYRWSLNAYPTLESTFEYLRKELNGFDQPLEEWQRHERRLNVFLLSCAIANELSDYLARSRYDFSRIAGLPLGGIAVRTTNAFHGYALKIRDWRFRRLRVWQERWLSALDEFLQPFVAGAPNDSEPLLRATSKLISLLTVDLPKDLKHQRLRNPAFFHGRDLTHLDVLNLGRRFTTTFPDRDRSILLVGLRTAGSFFGPLLLALLRYSGYREVASVTIRPSAALTPTEETFISSCAKAGWLAVILDEPPCRGSSTADVAEILSKAGFAAPNVVAVFPVVRFYRQWRKNWKNLIDSGMCVLTLEPKEWHKQELLSPENVERQIQEYFQCRGYQSAILVPSLTADRCNAQLQHFSDEKMHTRLKRVYEVQLQTQDGKPETRYVLAKSVGWGWYGYHAFLAAEQLTKFVPPILGLRDGILYSEWLSAIDGDNSLGEAIVQTVASYVANRVRRLALDDDPTAGLASQNQHKGYEELASLLGRAYGSKPAAALKRPRIQQKLAGCKCCVPTLIDGKMRRMEWVAGPSSLLKTDFEQHAMGKRELEIMDPAYDLADAILHFGLSEVSERELIQRYIDESGDRGVGDRLFLYKLLAGTWSMMQAQINLKEPALFSRYQEFNRRFLEAWEFLTIQSVRRCGTYCSQVRSLTWRTPLVVMDVDGVLDRYVFVSFPSTTAAGLQAISMFHRHDIAMALNSARSLYELQEYSRAYGFLGGVAEYGSAVWDATTHQQTVLVGQQALAQLEQLRDELRKIPGTFVNDRYQYSIRAYTFGNDRTMPLPTPMILELLGKLNLDQLKIHQTELDTAILAKDIDKGTGLSALLAQVGIAPGQTIAIGDSEPDLDMFRVAGRSFAPAHICCRAKALKQGCRIAGRPYQPGLLEIAQTIVHPDGSKCERCRATARSWRRSDDLFLQLLEVADHNRIPLLIRSMLDPMAIRAFAK